MAENEKESDIVDYLRKLQLSLVSGFEERETSKLRFFEDQWSHAHRGGGYTCVLQGGDVFEKAGIAFSKIEGETLPESATTTRKGIANQPFLATGVSLVVHPYSPMVPTVHMNVRYFRTKDAESGNPVWWFGGGYDLTPYYGYREDCVHWHRVARKACLNEFDQAFYEKKKLQCDEYFYIKHRNCARGIGGIFYDDLNQPDFETSFAFMKSVGDSFSEAYFPIVDRRKHEPYGDREKQFQLYRRGRYVEFNLVYDRGTLFGLQSGGRVESILMSMPPLVRFDYGYTPEIGSTEEALEKEFLAPKDWASMKLNPEETLS